MDCTKERRAEENKVLRDAWGKLKLLQEAVKELNEFNSKEARAERLRKAGL